MGRRLGLAILLAAALPTGTMADDWHRCPGNGWQVTGASPEEHALVCQGVAGAAATLAACGVRIGAVPRIRVIQELPRFCGGQVMGLYDPAVDEIVLGDPAICATAPPAGSLYDRISPSDAFVAIAAHEAAHAMLYAAGLKIERFLEHEYIAAIVQMSALPEASRARLLEPLRIGNDVRIGQFNPFIYAFAPDYFVALAWTHFQREPDGCAFLRAMVEGTIRLEDYAPF